MCGLTIAPQGEGAAHEGLPNPLGKAPDAVECRLISDLATDPAKRELFDRLALHLTSPADQVEQAMLHRKPGEAQQK